MTASRPNVLLIMTDEERYPPPYEAAGAGRVPAHAAAGAGAPPPRRAASSTATTRARPRARPVAPRSSPGSTRRCTASPTPPGSPSRPTIRRCTSSIPTPCPPMGDWFRAGRVPHPLPREVARLAPRPHDPGHARGPEGERRRRRARPARSTPTGGPTASTRTGSRVGSAASPTVPTRPTPASCATGCSRQEVVDLFTQIAETDDDAPWLAVASFVNPHDIAFTGAAWQCSASPPSRSRSPRSPRRRRSPTRSPGVPTASVSSRTTWPKMLYPQDTDGEYRRLYQFLQVLVDAAIMRILDELEARVSPTTPSSCSPPTTATCSARTADCMQKWHDAFDESVRVPMLVSGPGIDTDAPDVTSRPATSTCPDAPRAGGRRRRGRRRRGVAPPRGDAAVRRAATSRRCSEVRPRRTTSTRPCTS